MTPCLIQFLEDRLSHLDLDCYQVICRELIDCPANLMMKLSNAVEFILVLSASAQSLLNLIMYGFILQSLVFVVFLIALILLSGDEATTVVAFSMKT